MSKLRQHGPFAFFCLLFILPTLVFGLCTCEKGEGDGDWNKTEALKYKIGAIASILFAGGLGVRIPILRKTIPALHPDRNIFLIVKAFSAGVILVNIDGSYASYLVSPAAVGAMGYCYMWWTGWPFSDVMYVTRQNMANAVATVSKQLENVHETLADTKRHLSKKLENLDFKVEEQKEITQLIANDVNEVKSNLSQIGFDVELIHQMVSGLEGKVDLIGSKQDAAILGLRYLDGVKGQLFTKALQNVSQLS